MLGRGACPHASAHTASLLTLDLLKHLKGDAFVRGESHLWLGRGEQQSPGGQASALHALTGPFMPGALSTYHSLCIFYSCRQVTATHASSL